MLDLENSSDLHTQHSTNYCQSNADSFNKLFVFYCKVLEQAEPLPELAKTRNRNKNISGVGGMSKTSELFPKRALSSKCHCPLSITVTFCLCNRFMTQYPELSLVALCSHWTWMQTHLWARIWTRFLIHWQGLWKTQMARYVSKTYVTAFVAVVCNDESVVGVKQVREMELVLLLASVWLSGSPLNILLREVGCAVGWWDQSGLLPSQS